MKHWIGREVKRFLQQAHKHVPFLLQLATAPVDSVPELEEFRNEMGQESMDTNKDDDYAPTASQIRQEEEEEPLMMENAQAWDNFIDLVDELQKPWPQDEHDTDAYRKQRALDYFNKMAVCCKDLQRLKPEMLT